MHVDRRCTLWMALVVLAQGLLLKADPPQAPSNTWTPTGATSVPRGGASHDPKSGTLSLVDSLTVLLPPSSGLPLGV